MVIDAYLASNYNASKPIELRRGVISSFDSDLWDESKIISMCVEYEDPTLGDKHAVGTLTYTESDVIRDVLSNLGLHDLSSIKDEIEGLDVRVAVQLMPGLEVKMAPVGLSKF